MRHARTCALPHTAPTCRFLYYAPCLTPFTTCLYTWNWLPHTYGILHTPAPRLFTTTLSYLLPPGRYHSIPVPLYKYTTAFCRLPHLSMEIRRTHLRACLLPPRPGIAPPVCLPPVGVPCGSTRLCLPAPPLYTFCGFLCYRLDSRYLPFLPVALLFRALFAVRFCLPPYLLRYYLPAAGMPAYHHACISDSYLACSDLPPAWRWCHTPRCFLEVAPHTCLRCYLGMRGSLCTRHGCLRTLRLFC